MSKKTLYLGPRLKRLRRELGLTQANMAADLEVSPSYVALMERNQRPLTAELLLRLAQTYRIDLSTLGEGDNEELEKRLHAATRGPIFADMDLSGLDIADIAANYPDFAEAFLRLHQALSQSELALAERREQGDDGAGPGNDPVSEARAFLTLRRNCFPLLDDSAEALASEMSTLEALIARFATRHGLQVHFVDPAVITGALRWYDYHRKRIMLSNRLDHPGRRYQLALQLAMLEQERQIDGLLDQGRFASDNARTLGRRALEAYWAAALLMPYRDFARAAHELRYDVEALAAGFGVSFEQAAHRLTTLQRPGAEGVPFFFIRIDRAGNVSKRLDSAGFPFARHGGACPLWNVHAAFEQPGTVLVQKIELPDGARFLSIARTVTAGGGAHGALRVTRAIALACAEHHAGQLVYADALKEEGATPMGIACRFCHRPQCLARSAPPIGRDLRSDYFRQAVTPFAFADD
ncbi:MAG: helix-turn-helix domain-containing protein [Rhizomicrobium sp.]